MLYTSAFVDWVEYVISPNKTNDDGANTAFDMFSALQLVNTFKHTFTCTIIRVINKTWYGDLILTLT